MQSYFFHIFFKKKNLSPLVVLVNLGMSSELQILDIQLGILLIRLQGLQRLLSRGVVLGHCVLVSFVVLDQEVGEIFQIELDF